MKIRTKFFGEIEMDKESVFLFEDGIPGFWDLHEFVIIYEEDSLFNYLQSVEQEQICFVVMPPGYIVNDYDIEISKSTVSKLGIETPEDVLLYAILTIPENAKNMTANLKAPIILNMKNKKGAQELIDNEKYNTRYKIIKETDV